MDSRHHYAQILILEQVKEVAKIKREKSNYHYLNESRKIMNSHILTLVLSISTLLSTSLLAENPAAPQLTITEKSHLIEDLYQFKLIKFGSFTLKSGITSPIYMDLRGAISHPELFTAFTHHVAKLAKGLTYDVICGIPYGALPFASSTAYELKRSMIMKRKEVKEHGTRKVIEGIYKQGDTALIVEDVVTSGGSCLETIEALEKHGLKVKDIIVFMSYPKGKATLEEKGYHVHELLSFADVVDYFCSDNHLDASLCKELKEYTKTILS
jgi:uridine monophosphate synthetase